MLCKSPPPVVGHTNNKSLKLHTSSHSLTSAAVIKKNISPLPIPCLSSLYRSNGRNTCNIPTLNRLCIRVFYHPLCLSPPLPLSSHSLSISCLYILYSSTTLNLPLCCGYVRLCSPLTHTVSSSPSPSVGTSSSSYVSFPLSGIHLLPPSLDLASKPSLLVPRHPSSPRFFHFIPLVLFVSLPHLFISPDLFLVLGRVEG